MKITILKLILIVIIFLPGISNRVLAQGPPTVKESTQPPPPQVASLEVADPMFVDRLPNRSDFIDVMKGVFPDLVFLHGVDVDGLPEYLATDKYNTSLEVVGNEDDIRMIKWTTVFLRDKDANSNELTRVIRFVSIIEHSEGIQWLTDQVRGKVMAHPLVDYTATGKFSKGRTMIFDYTPKLKSMSVTIKVEK